MDSSGSHLSIPSRFIRYLELQGYTDATIKCYLHDLNFYIKHLDKDILVATTSDLEEVGMRNYFIYLFRDKLKIVHIPLFQPTRLPQAYHIPMPAQPRPKSLWQRIKEFFFGTPKYRKIGGQNEAMRKLWQRDKQRRI